MKRMLMALLFFGTATFGAPARAGIPVIDAANLAQAIQQVIAWVEQANQMATQITSMNDQLTALTGSRGLGDILSNPLLSEVAPSDLVGTLQGINLSGYSGLSTAAKSIRSANKIYNCEAATGEMATICGGLLNANAQAQANTQAAFDLIKQRISNINSLQGQIRFTADPKAIAEMQARIQIEQAQVAADANQLAVMQAMAQSMRNEAEQKMKERELLQLSRSNNGTETFTYVAR